MKDKVYEDFKKSGFKSFGCFIKKESKNLKSTYSIKEILTVSRLNWLNRNRLFLRIPPR